MNNFYKPGDWNALCDRCGFKYKGSELRKEWTGLMVCCRCFESRHPQTLLRVTPEHPSTPWSRPEPVDIFIAVGAPLLTEAGDFITDENIILLLTES